MKKENIIKGNPIFDSELNIVEPTILISPKLDSMIRAIQKKIGSNEFSVLLKGHWTEEGFLIEDDIYLPEQEVSSTEVDYKEDLHKLQKEGWNCIYHSHPFSRSEPVFSSSDKESINCHFEASLLGNNEGIKTGLLSFFTETCIVQVPAEIALIEPELPDIDTKKIKEKAYQYPYLLDEKEPLYRRWLNRYGGGEWL